MYERIVVGTDGSARASKAVDTAVEIAMRFRSELILVQGCGSPVVTAGFGMPTYIPPTDLTDGAEDRLAPVARQLRELGVDVRTHVTNTSGHVALCDAAAEFDVSGCEENR